jgi:putative transposase
MKLTYVYRIQPTAEQATTMELWLELLRRHWNYCLGQRLDWLQRTRCLLDRCSLVSEPIGEIPDTFPNYNWQAGLLKETKELFPDYKNIYHDVQQQNLKRLDKAWERWVKPDRSGKRGGRPRFKKVGDLRSFTFPRINDKKAGANIKEGILTLSKIGSMPIILHRPIPDGFTPKTCTLVKKADGWYACISLEDNKVPTPIPLDEVKTVVGVDVGLKEFLTTSGGDTEPVQQNFRRSQHKLARAQRRLSKMQKGLKNAQKQKNKIARIHQRIQRQRKEFHYKIAHKLVKAYDLIGVEDLNIKGLARTHLAKSILDAAWGEFITILAAVAVKRGVRVVKVKPHGTTKDCSTCGWEVPKTLEIRIHDCPKCLTVLDRDENAAINIFIRALNDVGLTLSACGGYLSWVTRHADHLVRADESGMSNSDVGSLRHTAKRLA